MLQNTKLCQKLRNSEIKTLKFSIQYVTSKLNSAFSYKYVLLFVCEYILFLLVSLFASPSTQNAYKYLDNNKMMRH